MSEPILRTEGLTKRFGGLTAVDNLSFSLAGSRLHAIIGPNGAGKTTFFNLSRACCRRPAAACSSRAGTSPVSSRTRSAASASSGRLQIKSVFPKLTVAENLWITRTRRTRLPASVSRCGMPIARRRETVERTLAQIGLSSLADRQAGTLSYGDVALLEIGMAVISEPRLLLLDEPTCGMSPAETERAVGKIRELSRSIDIIIIEHDMEVVFEIADDITVMAQGAILASGSPQEIAADERVREAYLGRDEDEDYVEEAAHA